MDLVFTKEHQWISLDGDIKTVGISHFAQDQLGEIVYVELPELEKMVDKGETIAVIESVKAASEIYSPVSGTIVEVNQELNEAPHLSNSDPMGEGWLYKIKPSNLTDLDDLMNKDEYQKYIQGSA